MNTVMSQCSEWLTMPDSIPVLLEDLKKVDYRLFYISNTNPQDYHTMIGKYPILCTIPGIASFKEGLLKPDPAIFRLFLDRFSLRAEECLFIDDMSENVKAAESLKFQTITLTTGAETLTHVLRHYGEVSKRLAEAGLIGL